MAGGQRMVDGEGQAAGAGLGALHQMRPVAADVVLILGDVGQMREIAEGAHDLVALRGLHAIEDID